MSGSHDGRNTGRDEKPEDAAVSGVAGAAGRDAYVGAQISQAERSTRAQPATAFNGEVYRYLTAKYTMTVADHSHSEPGRYNAPGQSAFYAAPTVDALKLEAQNYAGLAGKSVVHGTFQGEVLDLRATPGVQPSALMQAHGAGGAARDRLTWWTGEDAYTLPRALADVARERQLNGVVVPANGTSTNIALFPDSPNHATTGLGHFEAGYRPGDYTTYDANGPVSAGRLNAPHASVPDSKPNAFSPPGLTHDGTAQGLAGYVEAVDADRLAHSRAEGTRYGLAGAVIVNTVESAVTGHFDGRKLAADATVGAVAGRAETSLAHGFERVLSPAAIPPNVAGVTAGLEANTAARAAMRPPELVAGAGAAGVVGAVVSAGVTTWQDADAVKNHTMTAGHATADVAVQAGIGLGAGAAGAATGAAVGSVVPVAGTAVGAVVGFGVGVGVGYVAQHSAGLHRAEEAAGEYLTRHYEKPLEQAWGGVSNVVDHVRSATASGLDAVGHTASGALSSAETAGRNLIDRVTGTPAAHQPAAAHPHQPAEHASQDSVKAMWLKSTTSPSSPASHPEHSLLDRAEDSARALWQSVAGSAPAAAKPAEQVQQGATLRR